MTSTTFQPEQIYHSCEFFHYPQMRQLLMSHMKDPKLEVVIPQNFSQTYNFKGFKGTINKICLFVSKQFFKLALLFSTERCHKFNNAVKKISTSYKVPSPTPKKETPKPIPIPKTPPKEPVPKELPIPEGAKTSVNFSAMNHWDRLEYNDDKLKVLVDENCFIQEMNFTGIKKITKEGFRYFIENSKYLTKLEVSGCFDWFDDEAVKTLCDTAHKPLTHLNLSLCANLSAESLKSICEKFKTLESLNLSHCGVTDDVLEELKKALPHCAITP